MATSSACMIAPRTMVLSWLLAIFGREAQHAVDGHPGIVGKPGGEVFGISRGFTASNSAV